MVPTRCVKGIAFSRFSLDQANFQTPSSRLRLMAKAQEYLQTQIEISDLFHVYGELLSPRQRTFIRLYYDENLSLAEIAERHEISRQAVHDAIKHGRRALANYEQTLHLLELRRNGGAPVTSNGWRGKVETILNEMEKTLREGSADLANRLPAQIASLRELLNGVGSPPGAQDSFREEAVA